MPPEEITPTVTNPPATPAPEKGRTEPESAAKAELIRKIEKRIEAEKPTPTEVKPEVIAEPTIEQILAENEIPAKDVKELIEKYKTLATEVSKKENALGKLGSELETLRLIQKHYPQRYDEILMMAKAASRGMRIEPDVRAPQTKVDDPPKKPQVPEKFKAIFSDEEGEFSPAKLDATMDYFKWLMGELGLVSRSELEEREKNRERKQLEKASDESFNRFIETWSKRLKDEGNIDFDTVVYPEIQKLVVALKLSPDTLIDGTMAAELLNMALLKVPGGYEFLAKLKNDKPATEPTAKKPKEVAPTPGGSGKPAGLTVKDVQDMTADEILNTRIKPFLKKQSFADFDKDKLLKGLRR